MPALTVKNIPNDLYDELKQTAAQHHRSINSEVIVCLKRMLLPNKISPQDRLKEIQVLRRQIAVDAISVEEIDEAINEGRP